VFTFKLPAALDGRRMAVRSAQLVLPLQWAVLRLNLSRDARYRSTPAAVPQSIFHKFIILQVFPCTSPHLPPGPAKRHFLHSLVSLRYTIFPPMNSIVSLDLDWQGRPRAIASALLLPQDFRALVDPGPASTIENLREQLAVHHCSLGDLQAIFWTHIHLDHAGATGSLVQENPHLQVYVHVRGADHMADPSNLLASAQRLYGNDMRRLFGDFLPVPKKNLHVLKGGETLSFGARELQVLYTPGHASHHV